MNTFPVVGELDPGFDWLGTGFGGFDTGEIHGLARVVEGVHLELLAMIAEDPGKGALGRMLTAAEAAYQSISVLEIYNSELAGYLERRGYQRQDFAASGLTYRWIKK